MQIQFNQPVTLGQNTYGKGQHAVPSSEASGWFFDALVKEGSVVVLRADPENVKPKASFADEPVIKKAK